MSNKIFPTINKEEKLKILPRSKTKHLQKKERSKPYNSPYSVVKIFYHHHYLWCELPIWRLCHSCKDWGIANLALSNSSLFNIVNGSHDACLFSACRYILFYSEFSAISSSCIYKLILHIL